MKLLTLIFILSFQLLALDFKVIKLRGEVTYNNKKLSVGDVIEQGAEVNSSSKGSFVQFQSSDGSVFLLKSGIVKLDRNKNTQDSYLTLIKGKLFHALDKKQTKENVKIKTKQAVFGIRGTKYFIEVKEDKSYLCVCEGIVRAKDIRTLENFDIKANEDLYLYTSKDPEKKKANKMMMEMGEKEFASMGYPLK